MTSAEELTRLDLRKDAKMWMEKNLDGTIHPALNTDVPGITFSKTKEQYIMVEEEKASKTDTLDLNAIYKKAEARKQHFIAVVEGYIAVTIKKPKYNTEVRITGNHTWEEVAGKLKEALQKYDQDAVKGFKGFFRKGARTFGDNSGTFKSWLELLPTESHYLSILCGGLKLILGAASRISDIRSQIYKVIEKMPSNLTYTDVLLREFRHSKELHERSANFYVAIMEALEGMVMWCQKHVMSKVSMAIIKQSNYAKETMTMMANIELCSTELTKEAVICSYKRQGTIEREQRLLTQIVEKSSRAIDQGFDTVSIMALQQNRSIEELSRHVLRASEEQTRALNHFLIGLKSAPMAQPTRTPRELRLAAQLYSSKFLLSEPTSREQSSAVRREMAITKLNDILSNLSYERELDLPMRDVSALLQLAGTLTLPSQDRAVALMQSEQLQDWVTCSNSSALLVNGNMFLEDGVEEERRSPLTFVCAKFADTLVSVTGTRLEYGNIKVFTVRWFCGEHLDMNTDYDAHPLGMLNSCLSQLLIQISSYLTLTPNSNLDLSYMIDLNSAVQNDNISHLSQVFSDLVLHLPKNTIVFCIIDGIMYYEDSRRRDDLVSALGIMVNLSKKEKDCLFKLLLTAPMRSLEVQQALFTQESVLNMDTYIPENGGFTSLQWDTKVGRHIDSIVV